MVQIRRRVAWRVPILGALLVVLLLSFAKQQALADWLRLRGYTPSSEVSSMVDADMFTPAATHLFYINRPDIVAKAGFVNFCSSQSEQTIVLGCYHGVERGIYVLRIPNDSRLDGVMQVTAAHEMLHAGYDRLSPTERKQVDGWLQDYYQNDLKNERVKATIEAYKVSEPNDVTNEMHSVFGTEVGSLPKNLESYYARYFTNRQTVVGFAQSYQAAFVSRQDEVKKYDAQLADLKETISENEANLKLRASSLHDQASDLETLKNQGSASEYNRRVDDYNAQVATYNGLITNTKSLIAEYNRLVSARNSLALEQQQLVKELSGDNLQSVN